MNSITSPENRIKHKTIEVIYTTLLARQRVWQVRTCLEVLVWCTMVKGTKSLEKEQKNYSFNTTLYN